MASWWANITEPYELLYVLQDLIVAEMDYKGKMESLPANIERTASGFEAPDQYESIREKARRATEKLEAARKAAIEAADRWKTTTQPR